MERATTSTISGSDRRRRRRTPRTGARRAAVGRSGRTGCLRQEERLTLQSADGSHAYGLGLPLLVSTWIPWGTMPPESLRCARGSAQRAPVSIDFLGLEYRGC